MEIRARIAQIQSTKLIFFQKGLEPPEYIIKVMGSATKVKTASERAYPRRGPKITIDKTKTDKRAPRADMMCPGMPVRFLFTTNLLIWFAVGIRPRSYGGTDPHSWSAKTLFPT
jgi:hypothetical protein